MNLDNQYIYNYADLSTGHLTTGDERLLARYQPEDPFRVMIYPEGFFVVVPSEWGPEERTDALGFGFSTTFIDIIEAAMVEDVDILRFDRDGAFHEPIPTYDW